MEIYFRGLDREEVSRIGLEAARRAEFAMDADAAREIGRYASCGRDGVNMVQIGRGTGATGKQKGNHGGGQRLGGRLRPVSGAAGRAGRGVQPDGHDPRPGCAGGRLCARRGKPPHGAASRAPVRRNGRRLQFRIDSYIIRCYRATGPVQLSIM